MQAAYRSYQILLGYVLYSNKQVYLTSLHSKNHLSVFIELS